MQHDAIATTMVVLRDPGELFALRHTPGPDSIGWVERLDADSLELLDRSVDLPATDKSQALNGFHLAKTPKVLGGE